MNSDERMVMFRGALGGYSKKDVNEYIERISLGFGKKEAEYEEKISRLEREVADEKAKSDELSKRLDELACEAYENAVKYAGEKEKRIASEAKLDELACEAYDAQLREAQLKATIEGLCARIAGYEKNSAENASKELLEKVNMKVDEMISAADAKCADMISAARDEADAIRAEAEDDAEKTREKLKRIYKDAASEYYEEVLSLAQDIRTSVGSLLHEISARSEEFNQKIDYMRLESENAAIPEGVVIEPRRESDTQDGNKPADKSPRKMTISISSINEKIESFFKSAIDKINSLREGK